MKTTDWIAIAIIFLLGAFTYWGISKVFTSKAPDIKKDTVWMARDTGHFVVRYKDTGSFKIRDTGSIKLKLIPDTMRTKTDSIKAYKAYFETNSYERVVIDNKDLYVLLKDTITQNQLIGSIGKYVIKIPTQVINNVSLSKSNNQLYLGIGVGTQIKDSRRVYLPLSVLLKNKKDNLYNVSYDPLNNIIIGSTYIKIRLKK